MPERGFGPEHEIRGHFSCQRICDKELGLPLREGGDVSLFSGSFNRIPFPIADTFLPVVDGKAFIDKYPVGDDASLILSGQSFTTLLAALAKIGLDIGPGSDPRIDVLVDRLVGDMLERLLGMLQLQSTGYLLGGVIFLQSSLYFGHEFGISPFRTTSGSLATLLGYGSRMVGQVESRFRVPGELTVDAGDVFD